MQKPARLSQQHLIVFTRYPEPHRAKTRMIPLLGAEGAANLQRQMTEHTLSTVKKLQVLEKISVEIRFTGGNLQLMQAWLGETLLGEKLDQKLDNNLIYQPQGEGDLGTRMARSLSDSFCLGAKKTIIIGTDCPAIDPQLLQTAFAYLDNSDLVLGPALDGGYYLIGLRDSIPDIFSQLFQNIDWGTSQVFPQTVGIAQKLKLSITYLRSLADIDRPEDLEIWNAQRMASESKDRGKPRHGEE
ncbi:TIGR04282 family arsenosugar biosynthesis glycosyltransferase [Calothrix sp. UHCC 0171]|uniref:TIGR04282 family arsenosugar biosynthesis glycosyltransferase n=1 Tax=Calothrix sp. UHCC 0171 TaxID=3110245 RepID=UPI002B20C9C5|nr:TIGR04282 family arsenosugar biosynthesis glycosyltransferase [Calothrix sp. UHCC 0171]MEA5569491.1 TIGR04282 family arsenosugar biosynthesis glycosyltransferase [Calothrix sp. UHCC 0171]